MDDNVQRLCRGILDHRTSCGIWNSDGVDQRHLWQGCQGSHASSLLIHHSRDLLAWSVWLSILKSSSDLSTRCDKGTEASTRSRKLHRVSIWTNANNHWLFHYKRWWDGYSSGPEMIIRIGLIWIELTLEDGREEDDSDTESGLARSSLQLYLGGGRANCNKSAITSDQGENI